MTLLAPLTIDAPAARTRLTVRPRYEGSNICTWIGFKHVNYLVEEAVLEHLRQTGTPAGELYERYGLCVDLVDLDTRILHAFHIDDVATAEVTTLLPDGAGGMRLNVVLHLERHQPVKAVVAKVRVSLRLDPRGGGAEPVPASLAAAVVDRIAGGARLAPVPLKGGLPLERLLGDRNGFGWRWRIPYFYCHFTERMQMSGYLRVMEEVVDLFLAERRVSIKRLLDEQGWIPVVPHSRITLLDEARMEEELYTVFVVDNILKDLTYTARMECYVLRDGVLVPTASGRITHGYAVIENRRDWRLVRFDERLASALAGGPATETRRV